MLKITIKTDGHTTTLELEGRLAGPWVGELEQCWRAASGAASGQPTARIRVHLRALSYVDSAGRELLAAMNAQRVELLAEGCLMRSIVAEILAGRAKSGNGRANSARTKEVLGVILLLASLAWGPGLRAEEEPPLKLTLREAIGIALKQNPQVQIAVLNLAQSDQDQDIARSALLPQAQLGIADLVRRDNIEARIGVRIPGAPQHIGPFRNFQAGPQCGMPIFDLTLWRRWQTAGQAMRASEAQRMMDVGLGNFDKVPEVSEEPAARRAGDGALSREPVRGGLGSR